MAFDFKKLAHGGAIGAITDPARLFDALPNKAPGYGYLRAVQKAVLDAWSVRRDERDLVIKTNTGGGKTITGLLILQSCLNEGKGPALYLAPDPHLADQVTAEAANLGLSTTEDPRSHKFLSGDAICITTMKVLVNSKSRFGLATAGGREPIRVGSIVVDDAHAALALAEQQTHLVIPRDHPAYAELLTLFTDELRQQSLNALLDIEEGDRTAAAQRVPFWAWADKQPQALTILRAYRDDEYFQWGWPFVAGRLPICEVVFSGHAVEIQPPCPPIELFPTFAEAPRRIYLTATLADDSVLVTHFDADPVSIESSIVPDSAADLGDRLVLAPQQLNPEISDEDIRTAAQTLAAQYNVVVLVPSHRRASTWRDVAQAVVSSSDEVSAIVERLKGEPHLGLVVIVNRYDGIDLPDEACRVLIIDGLPQAYSGAERREAMALRDSEAMVTRQLQRLEQGMGRGVRSRDDRCAVVLLGARLTQLVARADIADRLSPATRAQLRLSRQVADDLEGARLEDLVAIVRQVVDGDSGFREASRETLVGVTYGPALLSPTAAPLRRAYNAAAAGRTEEAVQEADSAVNAALADGDEKLAGWLGETQAMYLHAIDPSRAQSALAAAARRNPAVLRPLQGLAYRRLSANDLQPRQAMVFLGDRYSSGTELLLGFESILGDLAWDDERTEEAEAALADLAVHLGLTSQRPEREFGQGPDVLWALGDKRYVVIEAKTGASGDLIWKKDIDQLGGSVRWCFAEYDQDITVTPLMVHPSPVVARQGTHPGGTRVVTTERLERLKEAVRSFATALATDDGFKVESVVAAQLAVQKLVGGQLIDTYSELAKKEK